MRGVPASTGAEHEERLGEEGQGAQLDESPHQVFRLQDPAIRDLHGHHGDLAQVRFSSLLPWKSLCEVSTQFSASMMSWRVQKTVQVAGEIKSLSNPRRDNKI